MLTNRIYLGFVILVLSKSMCNGDIASELTQRYNDDKMKCDKDGKAKPAYECSGLLIRGVNDNNKLKYPWSLKPGNKDRESFSVAFLRKDTRFDSFPRDYDTGFIIYPHATTKEKKNTYKVFCAFPVNAHSDSRSGHGCGQSIDDQSGTSGHCDSQGIKSFAKWISHHVEIMRSSNRNFVTRQCGFDMTTESAADDFALSIRATTYLRDNSADYSCRNNELVFHSWNEDKAEELPIEAFFYLIDFPNAYAKASKYQDEFYKSSGSEIIPIVGIRLPTKLSPNIHIEYKYRSPNSEESDDNVDSVPIFRHPAHGHHGHRQHGHGHNGHWQYRHGHSGHRKHGHSGHWRHGHHCHRRLGHQHHKHIRH